MRKTGKATPTGSPEKDQHAKHFDQALRNALDQWEPGDPTEIAVTFEATIAKNPGGIREYRVTISDVP